MERRDFLQRLAALGVGTAAAPRLGRGWHTQVYPFALGVASGDPSPDGVVLWTRLAPEPLTGGGMPPFDVPVRWEVAHDAGMTRVVQRGTAVARAAFAHSVHVELRGLAPDRWYYYRFMTGDAETLVARTRTMPGPGARVDRLRLAFASCQHYEWGHYTAHRHLAAEDLDLVAFLGDYIYEGHVERPVRVHEAGEPMHLEAYRNRYACYKRDPDLQASHAARPWLVTFDDHEVDNNWAGDVSENRDPVAAFRLRRAAAFRAYYEHMPLRRSAMPRGPEMLLYRTLAFGSLARFHVLDTRQYRSDQACGDRRKPPCEEWADPTRTMLGARQERWLTQGLVRSAQQWQVLAQQVVLMPIDTDPGEGENYNMDSWSGYPAARRRLTEWLAERQVRNLVTLTGDVHTNFAGEIPRDHREAGAPRVGVEYVGTSITSDGDGSDQNRQIAAFLRANPWVKYHSNRRGYVRCEVTPAGWRSDYRLVPYVSEPGAPVVTAASLVTPAGRSTVDPA